MYAVTKQLSNLRNSAVLSDETESDTSRPSTLHFVSISRTSESAHPLHHALNDRCARLDVFCSSEWHCFERMKKDTKRLMAISLWGDWEEGDIFSKE